MITAILLLALSLRPQSQLVQVELVEVNEYAPDETRFRQIILWRWQRLAEGSGYRVADWHLIKTEPTITYHDGLHWIRYRDEDVTREIVTPRAIVYTVTNYDPEFRDRDSLAEADRKSYFAEVSK